MPLRASKPGSAEDTGSEPSHVPAPAFPTRPPPPPTRALSRSPGPAPSRVTARARSTEVRRGLTWRGNVLLGRGGPWFCPEVGLVVGVSRNPRPAARPWRPQRARGSTPFLLLPRVSQLEPLNLQGSSPPCSLGNTEEPVPSIFSPGSQSPCHGGTLDSGIPGPSSQECRKLGPRPNARPRWKDPRPSPL